MLYKSFKLKESVLGDDTNGLFKAYANVFNNVDRALEVSASGSFTKTIKDKKGSFPICWFHHIDQPIGKAFVEEDEKGLKLVDGSFIDLNVQKGAETFSGMKKEYITHLSIGYEVLQERREQRKVNGKSVYVTVNEEYKLHEISMLTDGMACNLDAQVTETKKIRDGQGVGNYRLGDGGIDVCVCLKCGTEVTHKKGVPCSDIKCPDCGTSMVGKEENEKYILKDSIKKLTERIEKLEKMMTIVEPDISTPEVKSEPGDHSDDDTEDLLSAMKSFVNELNTKE